MPNRIIREGINSSERVDSLSPPAEVFYRRLLSVVDDYGRFDGRIPLLISSCFPLRVDGKRRVREADVLPWVGECRAAGLLDRYTVAEKPYIVVFDFRQQVRSNKSKYPAPPEIVEREHQDEADVEAALERYLKAGGEFCGLRALAVERQKRVGDSYIDLMIATDLGPCVIELKRGLLTDKYVRQVRRYVEGVRGAFGILAGSAISTSLDREDLRGIALVTYSDDLRFTVAVPGTNVNTCDSVVNPAVKRGISNARLDGDVVVFGDVSVDGDERPSAKPSNVQTLPTGVVQAEPAPVGVQPETWATWRRLRGKKLTAEAERLQRKHLGEWAGQGHDTNRIVEDAIAGSWQGLHAPDRRVERGRGSTTLAERRTAGIDAIINGKGTSHERDVTGTTERMDSTAAEAPAVDLREPGRGRLRNG